MSNACGQLLDHLDFVINFDGTLSINSQMVTTAISSKSLVLSLLDHVVYSLGGDPNRVFVDFSFFGDRSTHPLNHNQWMLQAPGVQACYMPVVSGRETLARARSRLEYVLPRFVPVAGGVDDPAEDSLGSLYKILSDAHFSAGPRRPRVVLTITDSQGHYAEDFSRQNQGPRPFPPLLRVSDALVCDPRFSYVPLDLLSSRIAQTREDTMFLVYTVPAFVDWWQDMLSTRLQLGAQAQVTAGPVEEVMRLIDSALCQLVDAHRHLPASESFFPSLPTLPPTVLAPPEALPSPLLRTIIVAAIALIFVFGWCVAWCLKRAAYLRPGVVPTVSMAPADSVAPSELRDEIASVSSGQFAS